MCLQIQERSQVFNLNFTSLSQSKGEQETRGNTSELTLAGENKGTGTGRRPLGAENALEFRFIKIIVVVPRLLRSPRYRRADTGYLHRPPDSLRGFHPSRPLH